MTNLEKIEAEERKTQRIIDNNYHCEVCKNRFSQSQLQLAHIVSASKQNIKMFGREIMYHDDMMVLTCPDCNSSVLKNRAGNPIKAQEKIIDILTTILDNDPVIFSYNVLSKAFDSLGTYKGDSETHIKDYDFLNFFFAKYKECMN